MQISTKIFEGYCNNCHKYGHKAYECRSNAKWTLNKKKKVEHNGNPTIGNAIQGIAIIIIKNMDMFLRIVLGHTSMVTTKGG